MTRLRNPLLTAAALCTALVLAAPASAFNLDFEDDGAGNDLEHGHIVSDITGLSVDGIGVDISAVGGSNQAVVFDTDLPSNLTEDPDLAAIGGPGGGFQGDDPIAQGNDGATHTGLPGYTPGNALIVQERTCTLECGDDADDNARGGTLIFEFDQSVSIGYIDILDIDGSQSEMGEIKFFANATDTVALGTFSIMPNGGDNHASRIEFNGLASSIMRMEVTFSSSGAVAAVVGTVPAPGTLALIATGLLITARQRRSRSAA